MNLIQRIDAALRENPDIIIVHSYVSCTYPDGEVPEYGPWQNYGFHIAPKIPLYDVGAFNAFMNRLLPRERSSYEHNFRINDKAKVALFSWLHYSEVIGTRSFATEIKLTDDYGLAENVAARGTHFQWERTIERSIAIWTAPCEKLAVLRSKGAIPHGQMKLSEYEKYRKAEETTV